MTVRFILNGQAIDVGSIDPHVTLLQWLRASGYTGTKEGCAEGECGACAVALVGRDAVGRACFEPVNSCLVPVWTLAGRSVLTAEGLAGPGERLHPVQDAMVRAGGSQCGYCTPGFVVSLFCEYYRPGRAAYDPESIGGNLCRCTGYRPIADAARSLPVLRGDDRDRWRDVLREPVPEAAAIEQARGAIAGVRTDASADPSAGFVRPTSLAAVFACLAEHPEATLMAGGTDLMVYANQRYERWSLLVGLDAVPELRVFEESADALVIGAGLPLAHLEARLGVHGGGSDASSLVTLLPLFSSRLIRNRATLGGSLATASPIGDSAPVLLALDATVILASARGERQLPLFEFFRGYRKTALEPGEIVVRVRVPRPMPAVQRFYKVSKRVMDDISTLAAAFGLDRDADGRVSRLRIAYGGIAATPLRALDLEALAQGRSWDRATLGLLLAEFPELGSPMSDHRGSAEYRRAVSRKLLERFFFETQIETRAALS